MPKPEDLLRDSAFNALPATERIKVMERIDPDFAKLSSGEKIRVFTALSRIPTRTPQNQKDIYTSVGIGGQNPSQEDLSTGALMGTPSDVPNAQDVGATVGGMAGATLGTTGGIPGMAAGAAIGGSGGRAAGQILQHLTGSEEAPKTSSAAAETIGGEGIGQGIGTALFGYGGKLLGKAAPTLSEASTLLMKAIKPRAARLGAEAATKTVIPLVQAEAEQAGKQITSIKDLSETVGDIKKKVWSEYAGGIGKAQAQNATIDGNKVADAIMDSVSATMERENPAAVKQLSKIADRYRHPISIDEAEKLRVDTSAELDAYFGKYPAARSVDLRKNPDTRWQLAKGQAIRDGIDDALGKLTGTDGAEIRKTYGALLEVQDAANRRINSTMTKEPVGFWRGLGLLKGAMRVGSSVMSGDIGGAMGGMGDIIVGQHLQGLNNADKMVEKVFAKGRPGNQGTPYLGALLARILNQSQEQQ